jgi:hypothetical protein
MRGSVAVLFHRSRIIRARGSRHCVDSRLPWYLGVDLIDPQPAHSRLTQIAASRDQRAVARFIRERVGVAVCAGGRIGDGRQANTVIRDGVCDPVAVGRPLLRNPFLALNAVEALGLEVPWPRQYQVAVSDVPTRRLESCRWSSSGLPAAGGKTAPAMRGRTRHPGEAASQRTGRSGRSAGG